jgi:hypothetical protein
MIDWLMSWSWPAFGVVIMAGLSQRPVGAKRRFPLLWYSAELVGSLESLQRCRLATMSPRCTAPQLRAVPRPPNVRQTVPQGRGCCLGGQPQEEKHAKANWRFTTENPRVKLKNLYPSF